MKMMTGWTLISGDLRRLLRDGRLLLFMIIAMAVSVLLAGTGEVRYKATQAATQGIQEQFRERLLRWNRLNDVALYEWDMVMPVQASMLLAGGRNLEMPRHLRSPHPSAELNMLQGVGARFPREVMPLNTDVSRLIGFDACFVIGVISPLLLILLAYASISDDRVSGVLRLVLSGPLSRNGFLLCRSISLGVVAMAMVLLISMIYLGVATIGGVALGIGGYQWAGFMGFSCLYLFAWLALILMVSTLSKNSTRSLVTLLAVWLLTCFVWPSCISFFSFSERLPTRFETETRIRAQYEALTNEAARQEAFYRGGMTELARSDDFRYERALAKRLPSIIKPGFNQYKTAMLAEISQLERVEQWGWVSPYLLYRSMSEAWLDNGISKFRRFVNSVLRYWDILDPFLRETDAGDPDSPHLMYLNGLMSQRKIPAETIPLWQMPKAPTPWGHVGFSLAVLAGLGLLTGMACFRFFNRLDI